MNLADAKELAKTRGIRIGKMNKAELIRAVQEQEGNIPCFKSGIEQCGQMNCLWRGDCIQD